MGAEWLEPPYAAGHWVPDQVDAAGGHEVFDRRGRRSTRVAPAEVVAQAPEVVVLAPCGFGVDEVEREARAVTPFPGWPDLPAVRSGDVWAVDASSYYSRPGPRLVDGVELLARDPPSRGFWRARPRTGAPGHGLTPAPP